MTLSSQVASLELARILQKLGVKQEAVWYWYYTDAPFPDGSRWELRLGSEISEAEWELSNESDIVAAFTVAELGEMLPARIEVKDPMIPRFDGTHFAAFEIRKHSDWEAVYIIYRNGIGYILNGYENGARHHGTEADARAKMLIYLLENKLITP